MGSMGLTLKPDPGRPTGNHVGTDDKGRKIYRMEVPPKDWSEVNVPPPKKEGNVTKIHVKMFLMSLKTQLWEVGGKTAFAKSKGMEFATEEQFKELFKTY